MEEQTLSRDLLLDYHNVHGKDCRIHENLECRAQDRTLVRICRIDRQRLGGLLPTRHTEHVSERKVPPEITTEAQLREFAHSSGFWRQ